MSRWAVGLSALCLVACKKGEPPAPAEQAPVESASVAPSAGAAEVADAGPALDASASTTSLADANVILISVDSLRADMPWAGYERDIAPKLTALEKTCVSYTRAYSVASHTAPSVGAIFFGKYPTELKRDGYFSTRFHKDNLAFTEILQEAGVQTTAGHAHEYMRRAGWDQGFARYELVPGIRWYPDLDENITGKPLAALAQKQLSELDPNQRFFAWYHFLDPHAKWMPHPGEDIPNWGNKPRDRYDTEVSYADKYIGQLLDFIAAQPWADRTVLVFTSDHGEGVGDHNQSYHGYQVWETMVHVPLFVCGKGLAPRRIDTPRSLIDLGPSILEIFAQKVPEFYRGTSLVGELLGATPEPREVLVDLPANNHSFAKRALVGERYKFVYGDDFKSRQLFDLQQDPGELAPIREGELWKEWSDRFDAKVQTLQLEKPTGCGCGCMKGCR